MLSQYNINNHKDHVLSLDELGKRWKKNSNWITTICICHLNHITAEFRPTKEKNQMKQIFSCWTLPNLEGNIFCVLVTSECFEATIVESWTFFSLNLKSLGWWQDCWWTNFPSTRIHKMISFHFPPRTIPFAANFGKSHPLKICVCAIESRRICNLNGLYNKFSHQHVNQFVVLRNSSDPVNSRTSQSVPHNTDVHINLSYFDCSCEWFNKK